MKRTARTVELAGSSYEIGQQLGKKTAEMPRWAAVHTSGLNGFGAEEVLQASRLFRRWCPGLEEELFGFADALGVAVERIFYYGMTCLRPRCSQIAIAPRMAREGRPLLARSYEFSDEAEDFTLMKTSVRGKHTHLGTSVLQFGRDEGFNECGLAVAMSSCGFPVGAVEGMRAPKVNGLQFWAVIRALLENCRDVDEALAFLEGMPIAYNLNLMLVDASGAAALVETMDGSWAVKRMDPEGEENFLCAANHAVLPKIIALEPMAMNHSLIRYQWMRQRLAGCERIGTEELKEMLLSHYPNGLCCHCFSEFFGTTKSMVLDPAAGCLELCWGGQAENGWRRYEISAPMEAQEREIQLSFEPFRREMGELIPISNG